MIWESSRSRVGYTELNSDKNSEGHIIIITYIKRFMVFLFRANKLMDRSVHTHSVRFRSYQSIISSYNLSGSYILIHVHFERTPASQCQDLLFSL